MRLLIAAGGAAESVGTVPPTVRSLIEGADEILVIAPTLPDRFDWLASATDKARKQADERLSRVLGHVEQIGASAAGEIGADDPVLAFDDAVAAFDPDHLLISLRDENRAGWQEQGLLDDLLNRFSAPLTVFVASG